MIVSAPENSICETNKRNLKTAKVNFDGVCNPPKWLDRNVNNSKRRKVNNVLVDQSSSKVLKKTNVESATQNRTPERTPQVNIFGLKNVGFGSCGPKKIKSTSMTAGKDVSDISASLFLDEENVDHIYNDDSEVSEMFGCEKLQDDFLCEEYSGIFSCFFICVEFIMMLKLNSNLSCSFYYFKGTEDFFPDADSYDVEEYSGCKNSSKLLQGEYASLGGPSVKCEYCGALMWKEERVNKQTFRGRPKFSICCRKGHLTLPKPPPTPSYLWQLYNDPKKGKHFQNCARLYNSMFCFTSTGGHVDNSINNGGSPYIYRLNGQNHHVFGSLIPDDGKDPKFCQLYIYDTENEVSNRMKWVNVNSKENIDPEIVNGLIKMLDEHNELVKEFRSARDRFEECGIVDLKIVLKVCRSESGRENNIGPSDEVAAIMVGDLEENDESRDIIIESRQDGFERISNIHPKLMALQYPILFPAGEDGYHVDIKFNDTAEEKVKKRQRASMKDFYSYRFQVRQHEGLCLPFKLYLL